MRVWITDLNHYRTQAQRCTPVTPELLDGQKIEQPGQGQTYPQKFGEDF